MLIHTANAEVATAWANWALVVVAVLAAAVAIVQIGSAHRSQREATAKSIWSDYEKQCFGNPKFANTKLLGNGAINIEGGDICGDQVEFEKYQWFVASMLGAAEEMITIFGKQDDWRQYVTHHLRYHLPYLKSRRFKELRAEVSPQLAKMIDCLPE